MSDNDKTQTAVEGLQQLGLKKYEAEVFVGLSQIGVGTAKDISELTDVPVEIDGVLLKALSKNKEDRQESVLYLRDGIQEAFGL